jgi:hypothetical protein
MADRCVNRFHNLFNHIDNWKDPAFLWVSSKGIEATKAEVKARKTEGDVKEDVGSSSNASASATAAAIAAGVESEDEDVVAGAEEG